jgi:hypothetical protein
MKACLHTLGLAAAAVAALAGVAPHRARAQVEVQLSVKPNAAASKAPVIQATVINSAPATAAKLTLVETDATVDGKTSAVPIRATAVREFVQGNEPIAIAVLVEGHQVYMGDPDTSGDGAFKSIAAALDVLTSAGPIGSKGELIVYGNSPVVKLPMGDLKNLTGAALGTQKDYAKVTARQLKSGVEQALGDLDKLPGRKILFIIGDGADTNPDNKVALAKLRKENDAKSHVEVWAVYYDSGNDVLQADLTVLKAFVGSNVKVVTSNKDIEAATSSIVGTQIQNRYYVTFPGFDDKAKIGFTWDGKPHTFVLKVGDEEVDVDAPLLMKPEWQPARRVKH